MNNESVLSISSTSLIPSSEMESLLLRAKNGDEAAFTQLYNATFQKIFRYVFFRVSHKEVAEDLTEDVFLKAFKNISTLQSNSFEAWLYPIARNRVIDYYRSKKETVPLEAVEEILEYQSNLVDILHLQDQQKLLVKLLQELGEDQQSVIKLKFFEQLSNTEIASLLNKAEGTIRIIQFRALKKLKELLERDKKQ